MLRLKNGCDALGRVLKTKLLVATNSPSENDTLRLSIDFGEAGWLDAG